ncbi:hypothetical protein NFI96_025685, partial [Prochilodus magdalenae]
NEYKMAATLRVILGADNAAKLTLPTGIPDSVEDLIGEIRRHFAVSGNFRLQYRDAEFDNEFVNLTTQTCFLPMNPHPQAPSLRSQPWPTNFQIPEFSYEVRLKTALRRKRQALMLEVKRNNQQLIQSKMERTFAYRRQEVIEDMRFIAEFKNRWPALFTSRQVNAEFTRITTVPLLSTFMSKLDHYSSQLMRVFKKKGGTVGRSINLIMAATDKNPTVEVRRECVLKALCVYLNEKPDSLMKECLDVDLVSMREMEKMVLGVYVVRHEGADSTDPPEDVGIVIEGCTVLQDLGDVASGCAVLLGLIYSLNLSYPKDLRYTFEFLQKVLMELDGNKLSNKVQVLKNKLHE